MENIYDVVIIGSGPAGLTAAIYAERAGLNSLTFEKNYMSGGQVLNTYEVDNYPGLSGINGFDMGMKFREHAEQLGAPFKQSEVLSIETGYKIAEEASELVACEDADCGNIIRIRTNEGDFYARAIVIATGAGYRKLEIPGEAEFTGMGVSYCATCDGAFFRNKVTAVIGGGDVAVEDAIFLARTCEKVYLIHRRDELRAAKRLQDKLFSLSNVEILWDTIPEKIKGKQLVEALKLKNTRTGQETMLAVDGIFVAVGIIPHSEMFTSLVETDEGGYIQASEDGKTSTPGIFAAGDIRTKKLRQIITAASDGANTITSVQEYLISR